MLIEQPGDPLGERLVEQVRSREVDGDAEVEAGRAPARELHHGGLEYEPGDGVHEAALLDDRQEGVGVEVPRVGCSQRTSASAPKTAPVSTSIFGW